MLRVGLTGGLGSGKSTVADFLRKLGAQVIEADALGRQMMEPGQEVYKEIVRAFGEQVVGADGRLDRALLAKLAFQGGRLQELNAIVHPAVIEEQRLRMNEVFARDPEAVAVVESALIFEVVRDARARGEKESVLANWHRRFDRIVLVTAPDELKVDRYVGRIAVPGSDSREALEADARQRLAHQISDAEKAAQSDYVLDNSGDMEALRAQVGDLWRRLKDESNKSSRLMSLE
jgi:dephospho-CoA kinase